MTSECKSVCLICLKRFKNIHEENRDCHQPRVSSGELVPVSEKDDYDLYTKFLHFVNRHLNLVVVANRLLAGSAERKRSENDPAVQAFCKSCREVVSSVCGLYTELSTVKLHLVWKLGELADAIEKGKKAVSHKLAGGLLKNLATQVNAAHMSSVWLLRKQLQIKCKLKQQKGTPKLLVHQGLFPEYWKFTYSATKKCLMVLIIIFALASSEACGGTKSMQDIQKKNSDSSQMFSKSRRRSRKNVKLEGISNNTNADDKDTQDEVGKPFEDGVVENEGTNHCYEDDDEPLDRFENDSDSDWSKGAASPASARSAGSDEDFDPASASNLISTKRWNLRRTRKRVSELEYPTTDNEDEEDNNFKQGKEFNERKPLGRLKLPQADFRPRSLPCKHCKKSFIDFRGLNQHLLKIHGTRVQHPCPKCGLKFKRKFEMLIHRRKVHPHIKKAVQIICSMCSELFPSRVALYTHKKQMHKFRNIRRECPICFKHVFGESRLERHVKAHEVNAVKDVKFFPCEVCAKDYYREDRLAEHMDSVHNGEFPCSVCDAKCPTAKCLRSHLETHETDKKSLFCTFCFRGFTNQQYYYIHKRISHNRGSDRNRYFCDKEGCVEEMESIEQLNEHLNCHVVETLAQIKQKKFADDGEKDHLSESEASEQVTSSIKNVESEATIEASDNLTEGNNNKCNVSRTTPNVNENIIKVEAVDSVPEDGNTVFKCSECGWGFLKKYTLVLHELIHTPHCKNGKGYDCPKCGKNCTYLHSLYTHYNRIHGAKLAPVKCEECNIFFKCPIHFQKHLRLHKQRKSDRKFICNVCNAECLDTDCLYYHKQQKHPKKSREPVMMTGDSHDENLDKTDPAGKNNSRKMPFIPRRRRIPRTKEELELKKKGLPLVEHLGREKCTICFKTFSEVGTLRKHIKACHEIGETRFYCCFCDLGFTTEQFSEMHVKYVHRRNKKFECGYNKCGKPFEAVGAYNEHLKSHLDQQQQEGKEKELHTLDEQTGSMVEAPQLRQESKLTIHYCKICTWGFFDPYRMELHELVHCKRENKSVKCPKCDKVFRKLITLQSHYNTEHGLNIRPYSCPYCECTYFSEARADEHVARHQRREKELESTGNSDTKFVCIDCGREYIDSIALADHRKRHDPAYHKKCPKCELTFELQSHLLNHLKRKHNHGEKFICDLCGMAFITQSYLRQHMGSHQDAKLECETCGKKFKRIWALDKHKEIVHEPNRTAKHVCVECGMAYKSVSGLAFHVASIHTPDDQKKFACPYCPKRYHRGELLRMHEKTCMKTQGIKVDHQKEINQLQKNQALRKRKQKKNWEEDEEEEMTTSESGEEEEQVGDADSRLENSHPPMGMGKRSKASSGNSSTLPTTVDNLLLQSMTQQQLSENSFGEGNSLHQNISGLEQW